MPPTIYQNLSLTFLAANKRKIAFDNTLIKARRNITVEIQRIMLACAKFENYFFPLSLLLQHLKCQVDKKSLAFVG